MRVAFALDCLHQKAANTHAENASAGDYLKPELTPVKTKDGSRLDRATLKEKYLACLRARSPRSLRRSVKALIRAGVSRDLLFAWAVKAGNDKKYVGKLLSECFCDLGLRDRKKGGGRRPSPEGALLFFFARDIFGDRHRKYLRAACR